MEPHLHSRTRLHSVYRDNFYHKESTTFHAPILVNLITAQYNFVNISCNNIYPNRTKKRQKIGRWGESHLRPLVKFGFHRTCCHEIPTAERHYVQIYCTIFHPYRSTNEKRASRNSQTPSNRVKCDCQCADFHENQACANKLYKEPSHPVS